MTTGRNPVPQHLLYSGESSLSLARLVRSRLRLPPTASLIPTGMGDDLDLVATELVTNAYNAGARTIEVSLLSQPTSLRIDITDDAPGEPLPADAPLHAHSGRGLALVAALSSEWGWRLIDGDCKIVWARFDRVG